MRPHCQRCKFGAATGILFLCALLPNHPESERLLGRLDIRPRQDTLSFEVDAWFIEAMHARRKQLMALANVTGRDFALKAFEVAEKRYLSFSRVDLPPCPGRSGARELARAISNAIALSA